MPRRIVLARPIAGAPSLEDFRIEAFEPPPVPEGGFRARAIWASVDPGTRSRLSGAASYAGALKIGDVIDGFTVSRVVESKSPRFPEGALVTMGGGWAEETVFGGRGYASLIPESDLPLSHWIGVLGVPGMTAWFGLHRVAKLQPGERVLVTSAAGPVGATAGQLAKAHGCIAVGLAGTEDKRRWLVEEAGFGAALDYRAPDLEAQMRAAMPEGADVLFDNVGNAMIDRLIPTLRPGGRIVVSGQVADYNVPSEQRAGLRNTAPFITHRLRMEGLVVFDDLKAFPAAQVAVGDLIRSGAVKVREERFEGLEALIPAFCGLFSSDSFGRRVVRLSPD
jgi:NADPH-dependent curcumin reductase